MTTRAFYQARADECGSEAAGALLDNVRDRNLRAQAAWQDMANRLDRTEAMRAARDSAKDAASQRVSEPEEADA